MIRHTFQVISIPLLTASFCLGQTATATKPGSAPQSQTAPAPAAASAPGSTSASAPGSLLPEGATVITIDGVCDVSLSGTPKSAAQNGTAGKTGTAAKAASPSAGNDCKTEVSREEFEKLMKTVAPGAPPQARRQIANRYAQLLTAANQGVKLGVDKDPDFTEQLSLMRLQLLMQDAERKLQTQASNVGDAELKSYYDQNPSAYEEVTLTRLFIPRTPTDPKQAAASPDAKSIADKAREQLAAGGDPEQVQKSLYEQLKNTTQPPSTKLGARRRGTLPAAQEQKLFSMKPGEVSEVFTDPTSYVIYRVDAKQQLPFDQVKEQVKQTVTRQRIADVREQINSSSKPEFNEAYFGPETPTPQLGPAGAPGAVPSRPGGSPVVVPKPGQPAATPAAPPNPK